MRRNLLMDEESPKVAFAVITHTFNGSDHLDAVCANIEVARKQREIAEEKWNGRIFAKNSPYKGYKTYIKTMSLLDDENMC